MPGHVFTYWHDERTPPDAFLAGWQAVTPGARAYDDSHVVPALMECFPRWRPVYDRIAIPACRSDLARLILLYRYGGFYTDAHTAPGDPAAIRRLLALPDRFELVVFIRDGGLAGPELPLRNGSLLGRQGAPVLADLVNAAFRALVGQMRKERDADGHVPYNIAGLTGAGLLIDELFDTQVRPIALFNAYRGRVHHEWMSWKGIHPAFRWYQHYQYREPGQHWSERQRSERLFDLAPPA